jgi:ADP-glucose pyrophosphorylase
LDDQPKKLEEGSLFRKMKTVKEKKPATMMKKDTRSGSLISSGSLVTDSEDNSSLKSDLKQIKP